MTPLEITASLCLSWLILTVGASWWRLVALARERNASERESEYTVTVTTPSDCCDCCQRAAEEFGVYPYSERSSRVKYRCDDCHQTLGGG